MYDYNGNSAKSKPVCFSEKRGKLTDRAIKTEKTHGKQKITPENPCQPGKIGI
jgi:hypothetical protein